MFTIPKFTKFYTICMAITFWVIIFLQVLLIFLSVHSGIYFSVCSRINNMFVIALIGHSHSRAFELFFVSLYYYFSCVVMNVVCAQVRIGLC